LTFFFNVVDVLAYFTSNGSGSVFGFVKPIRC